MKAELFTCDGLTRDSCLSKTYCAWCIENITQFCKPMNACEFTNSTNSSSSLVCEIGFHKYRCIVEKIFMIVLIVVLYIISVFILVDVIKSRTKKLLNKEYGDFFKQHDFFKSNYESLPDYENLQDENLQDENELRCVANGNVNVNEKTSLLIINI